MLSAAGGARFILYMLKPGLLVTKDTMNNNKRRSSLLALLLLPLLLAAAQARDTRVSAVDSLASSAGYANFVELRPALPAPQPAAEELKQAGPGAPLPGKDLSPVMQDQARIRAIIKLVSDIYHGAHLPYSQDGSVFKNKEGRLPVQPQGYYREYTLLTGDAPHTVTIGGVTYQVAPDLSARGSERVIIGGGQRIYYTPDHYANFIEFTMVY